jgi:pimeloyl-ACP methyl ester carboxylesterase
VDDKKIYIAGHSEGSTLAIMAGNERRDLAGLILLSGPGFKQAEVLRAQIEEAGIMAEESGAPQGFKTILLTALNDLYEALRNDTPFDITKYEMPEDYKAIYLSLANQRDFAKEWIDVDPSELLKEITAPVCIIQGDADTQVTVADAQSLAAAIKGEELHIFQGIDHVLKKVGTTPLPYGDPLRRVDGQVLKTILEFIVKN